MAHIKLRTQNISTKAAIYVFDPINEGGDKRIASILTITCAGLLDDIDILFETPEALIAYCVTHNVPLIDERKPKAA